MAWTAVLFSAPVLIVNVCVKSAMLFAPVLLMSSAASRDVPSHLGHFQNCFSVTPAQAGVHCHPMRLDSRLRGKDKNLQTDIENALDITWACLCSQSFIDGNIPFGERIRQVHPRLNPLREFLICQQALLQGIVDPELVHPNPDEHQFLTTIAHLGIPFLLDVGFEHFRIRPTFTWYCSPPESAEIQACYATCL